MHSCKISNFLNNSLQRMDPADRQFNPYQQLVDDTIEDEDDNVVVRVDETEVSWSPLSKELHNQLHYTKRLDGFQIISKTLKIAEISEYKILIYKIIQMVERLQYTRFYNIFI